MTHRTAHAQQRLLSRQACHVKMQYPELYAFLTYRDTTLDRALSKIPSSADLEASGVFDLHAHVNRTIARLPPGLSSLAETR